MPATSLPEMSGTDLHDMGFLPAAATTACRGGFPIPACSSLDSRKPQNNNNLWLGMQVHDYTCTISMPKTTEGDMSREDNAGALPDLEGKKWKVVGACRSLPSTGHSLARLQWVRNPPCGPQWSDTENGLPASTTSIRQKPWGGCARWNETAGQQLWTRVSPFNIK